LAIPPKKEKKILQKAQKFTQAKNWKKAIAQYRILLAEKENDQSLHNLLGDLLSKPEVNEKDEAIREFKKAAELYEQHGFMAQAIAVYKKIIRLDPDDIEHNSNLAELFIKHNFVHDAVVQLQIVADQYIKDNRTDRAIAVYEKILSISEGNEKVLKNLADLYLQKSSNEKASDIYVKLWDIYQKRGDTEKGIEMITKAIELNPKNVPAIQILSNYHIKNKNFSEALSFLDSVNAQEINNLTIKKCYAFACAKMERIDDAITMLEEVCSQDTDDIDSRLELGNLYLKKGIYDKAYSCLTVVGNHYYEKRDFEKYKTIFESYVEHDPDNVPALERLLHVYQILNETDKSSELEERLKKLSATSFGKDDVASPVDIQSSWDTAEGVEDFPDDIDIGVPEPTEETVPEISDEGIELGVDLESLLGKDQSTEEFTADAEVDSTKDFGTEIDFPSDLELEPETEAEDEVVLLDESESLPQVSIESELVKDDYASRYELGIAYKEMGLFEEAIDEFRYASQNRELNLTCLNMLGVCYRELGKYSEAIQILRELISNKELDNNSKAAIYFDLALTYEKIGDYNESYKTFSKVASLNPDFPGINERLEKIKNIISTG